MMMQHITSSPVEIHSMFHLLIETGTARHKWASYNDIQADGEVLRLLDEVYNGLLFSPVFERNENEVIKSLTGQVRAYLEDKPTYAQVGKFRRLVDAGGQALPIEDNGLSGKGFTAEAKTGGRSRIGSFAVDVNNRASALSIASSCTLRRMAGHLRAAGIKNPDGILDSLYERSKPHQQAYDEEVRKFKVHFEDAYEILAYLEGIKHAAGDDPEHFRFLFDLGLTRPARKEQMRKMSLGGTQVELEAYLIYKNKVRDTPEF